MSRHARTLEDARSHQSPRQSAAPQGASLPPSPLLLDAPLSAPPAEYVADTEHGAGHDFATIQTIAPPADDRAPGTSRIQRKLSVSNPDDPEEREADAMADRAVSAT